MSIRATILGAAVACVTLAPAFAQAPTLQRVSSWEPDLAFYANTYIYLKGPVASPAQCRAACLANPKCGVWMTRSPTTAGKPERECLMAEKATSTTKITGYVGGTIKLVAAPADPAKIGEAPPPPANPQLAYAAGKQALDRGDAKAAIANLDAAIKSGKLDAATRIAALAARGAALAKSGRSADAKADLDEVLKARPADAVALALRAGALAELGQREAARADVDQALKLNPRMSAGFAARARLRDAAGDAAGAVADWTEAIKFADKRELADSLAARAGLLRRSDRAAEAEADLAKALQADAAHAGALGERAQLAAQAGRLDAAIADYSKVLDKQPGDSAALAGRGRVHAMRGSYAEASRDFERCAAAAPHRHGCAIGLYLVRERAGQWAWRDLARATEKLDLKQWPSPIVHFLLGNLRADELAEAARHEDSALARERRCAADFHIGMAAAIGGDGAAARAALQRAGETCASSAPEAQWAKAELARLGAGK